ncbi:MAG: DUF975 family protein, partial [Lachnospiraceae bacterium]|nr:DUF975 family protein [Lachnospiraceae bacterium]
MWSIGDLKRKAKDVIRQAYGRCVLVSLIFTILTGGLGSIGGGGTSFFSGIIKGFQDNKKPVTTYNYDNDYDDDDYYSYDYDDDGVYDDDYDDDDYDYYNSQLDGGILCGSAVSKKIAVNTFKFNAPKITKYDGSAVIKTNGVFAATNKLVMGAMETDSATAALLGVGAFVFVIIIIASLIGAAFGIFVTNPFMVGVDNFFSNQIYEDTNVDSVLYAFKSGNYKNICLGMFERSIFITLWSMLFVIPGIVKSYEYRMVPYVLANDPNCTPAEAFAKSKQMMDGEKGNAFLLDLSFIGWYLLSLIPLVGLLYVTPYKKLTDAYLFDALRDKAGFGRISNNPYGNGGYNTGMNGAYGNTM